MLFHQISVNVDAMIIFLLEYSRILLETESRADEVLLQSWLEYIMER